MACCIEGCMGLAAYEVTGLKRDVPLKPDIAKRSTKSFGLCLDHYDEFTSVGTRRRGSNASQDDDAFDDGANGDEYILPGHWDDPSGKEDASGLRRSNRTFKRPRKYFEDEMIVEDEAFIFDGKAIERMFKNPPLTSKEKNDPNTRKAEKARRRVAEDAEFQMPIPVQKKDKVKTPKEKPTTPDSTTTTTTTTTSTKKRDKDKDAPKGKEEKTRKRGAKEQSPSTTLKKCWYVDCHKADRSLKLLRPFLVPTCKSHALRVETRLGDAIVNGTLQVKEGNNVKDSICGCCTGLYGKEVLRCSNADCAFTFCSKCATTLGAKHGNPGNSPKWVCWVCEAAKAKNKNKERPRYIGVLKQGNYAGAGKVRRPDKHLEAHLAQYLEEDPTSATRRTSLRQVKQKVMKVPDPMELGYYYTTPAPQPAPSAAPTRNQYLDRLLEALLTSVKFIANTENFAVASHELMSKVNGMFELSRLMKLTRIKETEHEHVWNQVKDFSELITKSIQTAEQLSKIQGEMNMYEAIPSYLADHAIAKHAELKDMLNSLGSKCKSVIEENDIAKSDVRKKVELVSHDLDVASYHRSNREVQINNEIRSLESDIAVNGTEASAWRVQEAELIERLVRVRANIARCEKQQEESANRMTELKRELVHTRFQLRNMELNLSKVESGYTSDAKGFELLSKLVEEIYWLHEFHYNKKNAEKEQIIVLQNAMKTNEKQAGGGGGRRKTLALYHNACAEHNVPDPCIEKPERLRVAISVIKELKSVHPSLIDISSTPPEVDNRYLMAVHDSTYIKRLQEAASSAAATANPSTEPPSPSTATTPKDVPMTDKEKEKDKNASPDFSDPPLTPNSLSAALRAAGAVCDGVDNVIRGTYTQAFCAVRPPGHNVGRHGRTKGAPSQGFCLLNNVAIGAKFAMLTGGYERVAVVDFDVHHGNGTQEILQGDDNFLFVSIHVHDDKKTFFPGTGRDLTDVSEKDAEKDKDAENDQPQELQEPKPDQPQDQPQDQQQPTSTQPDQPPAPSAGATSGTTPSTPATTSTTTSTTTITTTAPTPTPAPTTTGPGRKKRKREIEAAAFAAAATAAAAAQETSNILNVALKRHSPSATFIQAFKSRVIPRLEAYRPQIILISAGFDGHKDDPSNGLKLSDEDYFTITKLLMRVAKKFCGGKLVSVLEGGYQLEKQVLKKCVHAHLRALLSDDDHVTQSPQVTSEAFTQYTPPSPLSEASSSSSSSPHYASSNHFPVFQQQQQQASRPSTKINGHSIYPPSNYNPATTITKITKNSAPPAVRMPPLYPSPIKPLLSSSSSSSGASTPDNLITIIDDSPSDTQQTNKQTPPKKGSIESILL